MRSRIYGTLRRDERRDLLREHQDMMMMMMVDMNSVRMTFITAFQTSVGDYSSLQRVYSLDITSLYQRLDLVFL